MSTSPPCFCPSSPSSRRSCCCGTAPCRATDLAILGVMYVLTGLGVTVGFHRLLTHRSFQAPKPLEYTLRGPRLDGGAGAGDGLGGRPPQAPRAHRRGGRPAQPARRPRRRRGASARPLARAHGLAVLDSGPGQRAPYAKDLYEDPRHAASSTGAFRCWCCSAWPCRRWPAGPSPGHARRRRRRPALGRPRAHLPRAPRHLERQLGLPLPRLAPLRDRGPVHQRGLARAAVVRRVLAPQPPRLPALGRLTACAAGSGCSTRRRS